MLLMRLNRGFISAAVLCLCSPDLRAQAGFDAFLRFVGPQDGATKVTGESQDAQFTGVAGGWFAIYSFDTSIANPSNIPGSTTGSGAGKAQFGDFAFVKRVDLASPALFKGSTAGGHFEKAELALRQNGNSGNPVAPFYTARFETVFVDSIAWSGASGDDVISESVSLRFGGLSWAFTQFDAKGDPTTALTVNWDQIQKTGTDVLEYTVRPPTLGYPNAQSVEAGGSLTINPTTGPSDPSGIEDITIKTAGGYSGNISVDPTTGLVTLTEAQPVGGPYTIVIEAMDNNFLTTDASFDLTVGTSIPALLANPDRATRVLGRSVKIPTATLLANDSSGAVFDSLPSDTTALNGHVALAGTVVVYDPPIPDPGSDDTFAYRIHDSYGQVADGTVTVGVSAPGGGPTGNLIIRVAAGGTDLQLAGIPGRKYQLQVAPAADGPWSNFGDPLLADANGSAEWVDFNQSGARFYRAYNVP